MARALRVAYFFSHPIQYQTIGLRALAAREDLVFKVFYNFQPSDKGTHEPGFGGRYVKWDVPLLDGYEHEFLPPLIPAPGVYPLRPVSRGVTKALREGDYDLAWIHGWGRLQDQINFTIAKRLGLPVLLRSENCLQGAPIRPGLRQGFKEHLKCRMILGADALGYVGKANYEYYRAYRVPHERLFSMPYLVDTPLWRERTAEAAKTRGELARELGLEEGRGIVLFVGKFIPRKHPDDLIAAYAALCADLPAERHPYLLIVGTGQEEGKLKAQAAATGLPGIRFLGFKNQGELPRFYDLADIFAVPSANEHIPFVLPEAMACNCAVLASDECGAAYDLVQAGETGFIHPTRDRAAMARLLKEMLADRDRLERMKANAPTALEPFTPARLCDGLFEAAEHLKERGKIRA